jgi:hypothetical protein
VTNFIPPLFSHEDYRKSSFSSGDDPQCVEVARGYGWAGLRDSKTPTRGRLAVPVARLDALITGIKSGNFC